MRSPFKNPKNNEKDSELHDVIYAKVTKENHKHESPDGKRDEAFRKCKQLFKQKDSPADPNVLIQLEEVLRARQDGQTLAKHIDPSKQKNGPKTPDELKESLKKQREDYEYYIQHFLPALKAEITQSKKLEKEKAKEIGGIISGIISKSKDESRSSVETAEQSTTSGSDSDSGRSSLTLVTSTSSEESLNSTLSSVEGDNGSQPEDEGETKLAHLTKTRSKGPSGRRSTSEHHEKKDPMQPEEKEDRKNATTPVQKLPVNEKKDEDIPLKQPNNRNFHVVLVAGCALSTIGCIVAGVMTSGLVGAGLLAMAAVFAIAAVAELHSNFLSSKLTSINVSPLVDDKELTACSRL